MSSSCFSYKCLQTATKGKWHNICNLDYEINSISTDTRVDNTGALFLALIGEKFDAHNFINKALNSGSSALCLQKGKFDLKTIPSNIPVLEVPDTLKAYQAIANFHRKRLKNLKLIGITGSNGKTSTKDIISGILSYVFGKDSVYTTLANTNNLVGVPQNILKITAKHKFAVIELGSNHPGEIQKLTKTTQPDIAVITSIGPAHLEFFHNIDGVIKEKASIFSNFINNNNATAILPFIYRQNNLITAWTNNIKTFTFGNDSNADISWKYNSTSIDKTDFELSWNSVDNNQNISWKIPGIHQINNAAAAAATATAIGIPPTTITRALETCNLAGMRMRIQSIDGITWINDAYNANPASTKAGIDWIHEIISNDNSKKIILVLGDMLELGGNSQEINMQSIEYAKKRIPTSTIIGIGDLMSKAIKTIELKKQKKTDIVSFKNTESSIPFIQKILESNTLVYLKGSRGIALEKIEKNFT